MSNIHFALTEVTAPALEPFLTADAKSHLRVDLSDDDTLIDNLILAARNRLEVDTGRALITQTWDMFMDKFPDNNGAIQVPKPPLQSVTSLKYIDTDGVEQTWDSSNYRVDTDSEPGRITPAYNVSWPTPRSVTNAVTIRYICGYGDATTDIERALLQAMLMLIGHWYENREAVIAGVAVNSVPMAYKYLKLPYTVFNF